MDKFVDSNGHPIKRIGTTTTGLDLFNGMTVTDLPAYVPPSNVVVDRRSFIDGAGRVGARSLGDF